MLFMWSRHATALPLTLAEMGGAVGVMTKAVLAETRRWWYTWRVVHVDSAYASVELAVALQAAVDGSRDALRLQLELWLYASRNPSL